ETRGKIATDSYGSISAGIWIDTSNGRWTTATTSIVGMDADAELAGGCLAHAAAAHKLAKTRNRFIASPCMLSACGIVGVERDRGGSRAALRDREHRRQDSEGRDRRNGQSADDSTTERRRGIGA